METTEIDKWTRLARYQEKLGADTVRCNLCPHYCVLPNGKHGICRTRINLQGNLYTMVYGNLCSIGVDPIEKKPLFHFYPGSRIFSLATQGCNLRCLNCQNWQLSQSSPTEIDHYDMMPMDVIRRATHNSTSSIAFTYNEPTVLYEYMIDTALIAHENGLKTVLVSNGYINQKPLYELCPHIDAANIDLKCFDNSIYHRLTGGKLQPVLDSLKMLRDSGVWLEITNLLIPGWTDNLKMVGAMCDWLMQNEFADTPLHFTRFYPNFKLTDLAPTDEKMAIRAVEIARAAGMNYVYTGNISGFNDENTYCSTCKQLLIERKGFKVESNAISKGHCRFCGEKIAGMWE